MGQARKFSVYVDADMVAALDVLKDMEHCTRTAIINKAIDAYAEQRRRSIQTFLKKQRVVKAEAVA